MSRQLPLMWTILCVPALAQPGAPREGSVGGAVVSSVTRTPIAHVHVSLTGVVNGVLRRFGALTDGEGRFSVMGLPSATYSVLLERGGFEMVDTPPLWLAPEEQRTDLILVLGSLGAITGRVLDAKNRPMERATVIAERYGAPPEYGSTDDAGSYRLGGLSPGTYRVRASPQDLALPPESRSDGSKEVRYGLTWYPGSAEASSATALELKRGAELTGIDIRLLEYPITRVSGRIVGAPAGDGSPRVVVVQRSGNNGYARRAEPIVEADGSFEVWRLDPGRYYFRATAGPPSGAPPYSAAPVEVEVATTDVENVELRFLPLFDLTGQLIFEDTEDTVEPERTPSQIGIALREVLFNDANSQASVSPGGFFSMSHVAPNLYRVRLIDAPAAYVKAVQLGSSPIDPGDLLQLSSNRVASVAVRVFASFRLCRLNGTVKDSEGAGVAGAKVILTSEGEYSTSLIASTAQDGTYAFDRVRPGTYSLLAMGAGSDDIERYSHSAIHLECGPSESLTRDLAVRGSH